MILRIATACCCLALVLSSARSADPAPQALSATELAARLSAWQQDGPSYVRLRMEIKQPPGTTKKALQVQIKARRTTTSTDVFYQILWPKERKGETLLLRKPKDGSVNGWTFTPPGTLRSLDASQMAEPLFGSDLSYEDLVDNFFAWKNQTIVGSEDLDGVSCQILESKPGKGVGSSYASVRTWVDSRRLIPRRIEKYKAGGGPVRRIDATNIVTDDIGRQIPANLTVRSSQQKSVTELDGSRIKHDVTYPDRQFTQEALKEVTIPGSTPE
jgi:Outer membrane lipoprotein-sorting protein